MPMTARIARNAIWQIAKSTEVSSPQIADPRRSSGSNAERLRVRGVASPTAGVAMASS